MLVLVGQVLGVWCLRWWGGGVDSVRVSGFMWAAMESVCGVCAVREWCVCGVYERCARVGVVLSACVSTPREECVFHFSIVSHVTRGVPRRRVPSSPLARPRRQGLHLACTIYCEVQLHIPQCGALRAGCSQPGYL